MFPIDQKILENIGKELLKKEQTIAVAESVTTGLIQHALGSITNAMQFYQGGITAYNIAQKFHHLGVDPVAAEKCNAVSALVAEQMAKGVSRLFGTHWGIGITGYATPVPESGNKLFAYYAICYDQKSLLSEMINQPENSNNMLHDVQLSYTHKVLEQLRNLLRQ